MYRCTSELVTGLRSGKVEQPDVLSYTGELSRDHDDLFSVIEAASPTVIMAESTDQITGVSTSDAVDAASRTLRSATSSSRQRYTSRAM